jgi:hypothetical protein
MNKVFFGLFFTFFLGSWISNISIIHTTKTLLEGSSLELILAVSSFAGLSFFFVLRTLTHFKKSNLASWLILPVWMIVEGCSFFLPEFPVWSALSALVFGELVKWHAYSVVLNRFGPLSAGKILGWAVVAYELGTVCASMTYEWTMTWQMIPFKVLALAVLYLPFVFAKTEEIKVNSHTAKPQTYDGLLFWLVSIGVVTGFLKISADTGFKFAVGVSSYDVGPLVANFYLVSACFTISMALIKRVKWLSPRMGYPKASLILVAIAQLFFGVALISGNLTFLVVMSAFQRSVDKIFYQPTMQLLTSGFTFSTQDYLRRWHVNAFLALGSLLGLVAFMGHGLLGGPKNVMIGMSVNHILMVVVCIVVASAFFKKIIQALDSETKKMGTKGNSRPMAMLALLSPKHFLVHALLWSSKRGGQEVLPPELISGLTADSGGEVVQSFYAMFERLTESHQLAVIRLATLLNHQRDRDFMLLIALEKIQCGRRPRRLAALNLVKIHGKRYRPLLRRSRGKNSPLTVHYKKSA